MRKRVFIIHGWQGSPEEGWFPWLRRQLVARGVDVTVPPMPDPAEPSMQQWIAFLSEQVGTCDENTFFVGHSLGPQAILRYLQRQPSYVRCGGAVFAAAFEKLGGNFYRSMDAKRALTPWLEEPIHWEAIRGKGNRFVAIFSDNDDWVPLSNVEVFSKKLHADTLVLHDRGHFSGSDGMTEFPELLEELWKVMGSGEM